jgi:predicted phage terminase large subunit-like protein
MLQDLLDNPNRPILFGSKSGDLVQRTAKWLRDGVYSIYKQEGELWTDHKFTVPKWDSRTRDPSWLGTTLGHGVEGIRAQRAYLDDPIDRDSQTSEVYKKDAISWFSHTYRARMNKGCPLVVIGSPWAPGDLYDEFVKRGMETHVFPMLRSPKAPMWARYDNVKWHGEEYDVLWPENWQGTDIPALKREIGGQIPFDQRYMVNPQAIEGCYFKPDWFHYYDSVVGTGYSADPEKNKLVIEMGVDPAIKGTELSDFTAICIIGVNLATGNVYILAHEMGKYDTNCTTERIKALAKAWNPTRIVIENNAAQQTFVDTLRVNTMLPVIGQAAVTDKKARIATLAVPVETGRIVFHRDMHDLIQQFLYFPDAEHDDGPDSVEIVCRHWFLQSLNQDVQGLDWL